MKDKRQHKRYKLDLIDVQGKMTLTDKVEILDISLGGVALKVDRKLNPGREYVLRLVEEGKSLDVKGTVVRAELIGTEARAHGESVTVYAAGMRFSEASVASLSGFLKPHEHRKKEQAVDGVDRRLAVRFTLTAPRENILNYPAQFKVKAISLSGMLIQADQALEINSGIPMELSLNAESAVNFIGRVAFCKERDEKGLAHYEIGVEFKDLTDNDKSQLNTFIGYLAAKDAKAGGDSGGIL